MAASPLRVDSLTGLYSQLCGVLAGFTFAGLSVYLAQTNLPPEASGVVTSLFCAFVALVLMSIVYTLLSGDAENRRAVAALFFHGLPVGLSIATMFYAVALMAKGRPELAPAVELGKVLVSVVVPTVVILRLSVTARYLSPDRARSLPSGLGFALAAVQLVVGLIFVGLPAQHVVAKSWNALPAYIALATATLALAASPVLSTRPVDFLPSHRWQYVNLVVSFCVLAVYSLCASIALTNGSA